MSLKILQQMFTRNGRLIKQWRLWLGFSGAMNIPMLAPYSVYELWQYTTLISRM